MFEGFFGRTVSVNIMKSALNQERIFYHVGYKYQKLLMDGKIFLPHQLDYIFQLITLSKDLRCQILGFLPTRTDFIPPIDQQLGIKGIRIGPVYCRVMSGICQFGIQSPECLNESSCGFCNGFAEISRRRGYRPNNGY